MSTVYIETIVAECKSESTIVFSGDVEVRREDPKKLATWQYQYSISLDELEEIICELRQHGANRVEISYHNDHQEYLFTGTSLEENLDPKAELALRINDLQSDLEVRKTYRQNYKENLAKVEEIIVRDTAELDKLLKEYASK